jgi:hypothetical protein
MIHSKTNPAKRKFKEFEIGTLEREDRVSHMFLLRSSTIVPSYSPRSRSVGMSRGLAAVLKESLRFYGGFDSVKFLLSFSRGEIAIVPSNSRSMLRERY